MNVREQFGGRLLVGMKPGTRRKLKRQYSKHRRQQERRDPEAATTKRANYRGWYD